MILDGKLSKLVTHDLPLQRRSMKDGGVHEKSKYTGHCQRTRNVAYSKQYPLCWIRLEMSTCCTLARRSCYSMIVIIRSDRARPPFGAHYKWHVVVVVRCVAARKKVKFLDRWWCVAPSSSSSQRSCFRAGWRPQSERGGGAIAYKNHDHVLNWNKLFLLIEKCPSTTLRSMIVCTVVVYKTTNLCGTTCLVIFLESNLLLRAPFPNDFRSFHCCCFLLHLYMHNNIIIRRRDLSRSYSTSTGSSSIVSSIVVII